MNTILLAGDTIALVRGKACRFIIGMDKERQEESIAASVCPVRRPVLSLAGWAGGCRGRQD